MPFFFCRYWHKFINEELSDEQVGFMDPGRTNAILMNDDQGGVVKYIMGALRANRDKRLIFIPYHQMLVLYIYYNFILFLSIHINYRI